jgi:aspartyl-tRNA(Asn)/glutamyl-tRNA(Gln) amidotransferase subunit C
MSVSVDDVRRIAALSRLSLESAELRRMADQLNGILGHMTVLRTLDVTGVPASATALAAGGPLRADEPGPDPLHDELAAIAPAWRDGFFTVPRLAAHGHVTDGTDEATA